MAECIYEYDGLLEVETTALLKDQIRRVAASFGLVIDVYGQHVEFSYSGRDAKRFVRECLRQLAEVVGEAGGEITCMVSDDTGEDPSFEFYSIAGSKLYMQLGRIVRDDSVVVVSPAPPVDS